MKKESEIRINHFFREWRQDDQTGFLKETLHMDDVITLIEEVLEIENPEPSSCLSPNNK